MNTQPPQFNRSAPSGRRRRKLSVEVYFVLYLTAIMLLLLGTAPLSDETYDAELEEAIAQLINTDFEVDVEHIALLVPFVPAGMESDSAASRIRYDTANRILAHGSFSQVKFRLISIEDTLSGDPISIERATFFPEGDSSAVFIWNQQNATRAAIYRVRVEAEARPVIPASVTSPTLRQRIESIVTARSTLRDTATFTINVLPISDYLLVAAEPPLDTHQAAGIDGSLIDPNTLLNRGGDFGAFSVDNVKVPPGTLWTHKITLIGISPKEVSLDLPRGVRRAGEGGDHLYVSGTAPNSGDEYVRIGIVGPQGVTRTVFFNVSTSSLDAPKDLPENVYPGSTYRIDFSSDGFDNGRISVDIVENGTVVARDQGAIIEYRPTATKGNVTFVRQLDDIRVGEYRANIQEIPAPIWKVVDSGPTYVRVKTVAYGKIKGQWNMTTFRTMEGNAGQPEKIGAPEVNELDGSVTQEWKITVQDPSKPFQFTARAWDRRGMVISRDTSDLMKYQAP